MGILIIATIVVLLATADGAIVVQFRRKQAGLGWWSALTTAWLGGTLLGIWSGFFFEYRPDPDLRVAGAPIPVALFHWEGPPGDERWIDFVPPVPILHALADVVIVGLMVPCPLGLAFWLVRRRDRRGD